MVQFGNTFELIRLLNNCFNRDFLWQILGTRYGVVGTRKISDYISYNERCSERL